MAVILACLSPADAVAIWDRLRPMIDRGYSAGGAFMPVELLDNVKQAKTLVWVAIEEDAGAFLSVATTELVPMRKGLVCWINQCAGEQMATWLDFIDRIEEYARVEGCVKTILQGRRGWERALRGKQYRVRTVQLEKTL